MNKIHPTARLDTNKFSAYSTPKPDVDREVRLDHVTRPSLIQTAQIKNLAYYEQAFAKLVARHTKEFYVLAKEFHDGGAWAEHYKTWAAAREHVLKISSAAYYKGVSKICDDDKVVQSPLSEKQVESHCLMAIEEARAQWVEEEERKAIEDSAKQSTPKEAPAKPSEGRSSTGGDPVKPTNSAAHNNGSGAKLVNETAPAAVVARDATGYPIPKLLLELWEHRDEVQAFMTMASKLKCLMDKLQSEMSKMPWYRPMAGNVQTHMEQLRMIHFHLSYCKPWAVCPICSGTLQAPILMNPSRSEECRFCYQTGMVSELAFNRDWNTGHTQLEREQLLAKREKLCSNSETIN